MIATITVFSSISLILGIVCGYFSIKQKSFLRIVTKTLASTLFLIVGLLAMMHKGNTGTFDVMIMVALLFGLLGDIFLCFNAKDGSKDGKMLNLFGILTFALGHLAYVIGLLVSAPFTPWTIALAFVIPLYMVVLILTKSLNVDKKMTIFLGVYGVILSLMFMSSVNFYLANKDSLSGLFVLLGGVIFTSSDASFVIRDFSVYEKARTPLKFYVLVSYYIAQLCFAIAMMF